MRRWFFIFIVTGCVVMAHALLATRVQAQIQTPILTLAQVDTQTSTRLPAQSQNQIQKPDQDYDQSRSDVPTPKVLQQKSLNVQGAVDAAQGAVNYVSNVIGESKVRRANSDWLVLVNYSPIDILLPNKYGLTLGWIVDPSTTYELEYVRSDVSIFFDEIGSLSEERISLLKRSYKSRNSLNITYGLVFFNFGVHLSDALMDGISPIYASTARELVQQSLGFHIGVSNRWTIKKNMTFTVDWVSWSQPVFELYKYERFTDHTSDHNDKDDVKKVMRFASYFPRLTFLKMQFGMSF
ncbi:MAG: hypothetical protein M9899_09090 [Bdellovibrionaceae bacterium]|nr:hypothetical protein [Pseudobdellovibrionaceae bacterium]